MGSNELAVLGLQEVVIQVNKIARDLSHLKCNGGQRVAPIACRGRERAQGMGSRTRGTVARMDVSALFAGEC
jgi:hypothetical protein